MKLCTSTVLCGEAMICWQCDVSTDDGYCPDCLSNEHLLAKAEWEAMSGETWV